MAPVERPLPALPLPPARNGCAPAPTTTPPAQGLHAIAPSQGFAAEFPAGGPVSSPAEITVRVQSWLAAGTPRLVMELGGAWGGRLDVERTGPGRVRVRWQVRGTSGAARLSRRLHEALGSAGLAVDGLSVVDGG